jgi:acetylornithine deacetylase/succinyl-diaminopimelate desuccinylase-like protein
MLYTEVTISGPSRDLHSGMYGGAVINPNNALAKILAQLIDEHGVVQVPGYYDDVIPPGKAELDQWTALGFDETGFLGEIGLTAPSGEAGYTTLERLWSRPTCDVNGMWGGYTGAGSKTVIPSHASAKISFRLVPGQDPEKILTGLRAFLDARMPKDFRYEITTFGKSPAIRVPTDSRYLGAVLGGLGDVYAKAPVLIGAGGSIPVVGMIQQELGFDSLLVGFGLEDDRVHSPDEKFEVACYRNGIRSHAAILGRLAGLGG